MIATLPNMNSRLLSTDEARGLFLMGWVNTKVGWQRGSLTEDSNEWRSDLRHVEAVISIAKVLSSQLEATCCDLGAIGDGEIVAKVLRIQRVQADEFLFSFQVMGRGRVVVLKVKVEEVRP